MIPGAPADFRRLPVKTKGCSNPSHFLFITHEGLAALCCTDQNARHVLGDVRRQSIAEIWYAPANQDAFRNIHAGQGPCPTLCHRDCHLQEPDLSGAEMHPALRQPWTEVLAEMVRFAQAGSWLEARAYLFYLEHRQPKTPEIERLKVRYPELTAVAPRKPFNLFSLFSARKTG